MNNLTSLNLGHTYHTNTGTRVTPIKALPNQKAIFVTDEFYPTPFVAWSYSLSPTDPDLITLYSGSYYHHLDQALDAESNKPGPMRLRLSFYCPDCEEFYKHEFTYTSVLDLVEQIEDARVSCPECGYMFMGIHSITLTDSHTYDLPLWHGPVPSESMSE